MAHPRTPRTLLRLPLLFLLARTGGVLATELANSETRLGILRGSEPGLELSRVIQLSASPKVFQYDGFLSDSECQYLILSAKQKLERPTGTPLASATILRKYQDAIVRKVEDRITEWVLLPRGFPDEIKVMRYNAGQTFDVHYEFYSNPSGDQRKGGRAATVLLFLSDVESGGEVVFPHAALDEATLAAQRRGLVSPNACNSDGLVVRPRKGTALFFMNLLPDGQADPASELHECPVLAGERWLAAKWVAVQKYSRKRSPYECLDEHESCGTWARAGECQRNPGYMVGEKGSIGFCRKACKACDPKKG